MADEPDEDNIDEQKIVFKNNGKFTAAEKTAILNIVKAKRKWVYDDTTINPDNIKPYAGGISIWNGDDLVYSKSVSNHIVSDYILRGDFDGLEKNFLVQTTSEAGNKRRAIRATGKKYADAYKTGYHVNYYMALHV